MTEYFCQNNVSQLQLVSNEKSINLVLLPRLVKSSLFAGVIIPKFIHALADMQPDRAFSLHGLPGNRFTKPLPTAIAF